MNKPTLLSGDQAQILNIAEALQRSPAGIVSRTLLQTPELRLVLFTFAEGQELTSHTSSRRAVIQILDGCCDFLLAEEWHRVAAGALIHLPPNHPHAVRAAGGPFSMLLTLGADSPPSRSQPDGPAQKI